MRTREEKLAYAKGYNARAKWPLHKPPMPPEPMVAKLMTALTNLRNAVDGELAKFGEDDPIGEILGPRIDEADEALSDVGTWLLFFEDETNSQPISGFARKRK